MTTVRNRKSSRAATPRPSGRGRQVTWNGRRVLVDVRGRVTAGVPEAFIGVHVDDLDELARGLERSKQDEATCKRSSTRQRARTFRTKAQGVRALLDANPPLANFLEHECSNECHKFHEWVARGRRGRKQPAPDPHDGRFDVPSEKWSKRGGRRIASWLEAVHATSPPSRRWEDFTERVEVLSEATGFDVAAPEEAEALLLQEEDFARCEEGADDAWQALLDRAQAGRLAAEEDLADDFDADVDATDDKVPF